MGEMDAGCLAVIIVIMFYAVVYGLLGWLLMAVVGWFGYSMPYIVATGIVVLISFLLGR